MCETTSPTIPPAGMGEIRFPENGNAGSGDIVCGSLPKRKRRTKNSVYTQKPQHTILSFEEFYAIQKKNENEQKHE